MNITISVVRYRNSVTQGGAYVLINGERVPCVHGLSYNDTIKVWLESEAEEKR